MVQSSQRAPRGRRIALLYAKIPSALSFPLSFVLDRAALAPSASDAAGSATFSPCCVDMFHFTTPAGGGHLRSALLLRCSGVSKDEGETALLSLFLFIRTRLAQFLKSNGTFVVHLQPTPSSPPSWLASRLNAGFPSRSSHTGARARSRSLRVSCQGHCRSSPFLLECRLVVPSALRLRE